MTVLPLLFVSLATSAPSAPRALPGAELTLHLPQLAALPSLEAFLQEAGRHAGSLRPEPLGALLHPFLRLQGTDAAGWSAQGLGRHSWLTASHTAEQVFSCVELERPDVFRQVVDARLAELGALRPLVAPRIQGAWTETGDGIQAGYVLRGKVSCAARGPNAKQTLLAQVGLLAGGGGWGRWKAAATLDGTVWVLSGRGAIAARAEGKMLQVDALPSSLALPALAGAGPSPYAPLSQPKLLTARVRLTANGVSQMLAQAHAQLTALCAACSAGPLFEALGPKLTGQLLVHVASARPQNGLRTWADRYFSVRHALVFEVRTPQALQPLLEKARSWPDAQPTKEGLVLVLPGGKVEVTLRGEHLGIANHSEALETALSAVSASPQPLPHGAEWAVDGPSAGRALGGISLFDVMAEPHLAPLLGAALEFRPLLLATRGLSGSLEEAPGPSGSGTRLRAQWTLEDSAPR